MCAYTECTPPYSPRPMKRTKLFSKRLFRTGRCCCTHTLSVCVPPDPIGSRLVSFCSRPDRFKVLMADYHYACPIHYTAHFCRRTLVRSNHTWLRVSRARQEAGEKSERCGAIVGAGRRAQEGRKVTKKGGGIRCGEILTDDSTGQVG